jgi:hypothetical protein
MDLSGGFLVTLSIVLIVVVVVAAHGIGAVSRTVGLHVPFIHQSQNTWIRGHRAALYTIAPACCFSTICGISDIATANHFLLGVGWIIWGAGFVGGALLATAAAYSASQAK